jgi:two-component system phosphate regulon sensor histidine kinase PhoR
LEQRSSVAATPEIRAWSFWKMLTALSAVSLAVILSLALTLSSVYRSLLDAAAEDRLRSVAAAYAQLWQDHWPEAPLAEVQAALERAGQATGLRLTLIKASGQVLADSSAGSLEGVEEFENHLDRPEVLAALRRGEGSSTRLSPTVGGFHMYYAVRIGEEKQPQGVVRSSLPMAAVTADLNSLQRWTWTVALAAFAASVAASTWLAARATQPLRKLAAAADAILSGEVGPRTPVAGEARDEVAALSRALGEAGKLLARREKMLRESNLTQAVVLEGMAEGVVAVDREQRVLFANAAAGRSLGFKPERVVGSALLEAVRSHELHALVQQALRFGELATGELARRGGSRATYEVLVTPLPGDPPSGAVVVLRDVSEPRRLDQMRQQFVANVSHELKTPLSSIRAYAETLLAGAKNDPVHSQRFLERIDEQAGRLQQLIVDMLSLAKIESGQGVGELTRVPLVRVVRRCCRDFEPQAAARRVALVCEIADPALAVKADEEALWQIFDNLIDNALKYTPPDGKVSVQAQREGIHALIEVVDTGSGISQEHHDRIFERFYRVDKARSRELGGTGLGLSIVKHLVQAMGGAVGLISQPGQGCRFQIRLPLAGGA